MISRVKIENPVFINRTDGNGYFIAFKTNLFHVNLFVQVFIG